MVNLKIAILYSGFLRGFENVKSNHHEFLHLSNNVKGFIHTWNILGDAPMDGRFKSVRTHKVINNYFNPTRNSVLIENLKDMQADRFKKYAKDRSPQRLNSMLYSNQKSFELIDEGFDLYIKTRGDIEFVEPLDINLINSCVKYDSLVTPSFGGYSGMNDQFAYGSYNAMKAFCSTFNNLDILANQTDYMPESLVAQNIKNLNINVLTDTKVKYLIHRGDGNIFKQY